MILFPSPSSPPDTAQRSSDFRCFLHLLPYSTGHVSNPRRCEATLFHFYVCFVEECLCFAFGSWPKVFIIQDTSVISQIAKTMLRWLEPYTGIIIAHSYRLNIDIVLPNLPQSVSALMRRFPMKCFCSIVTDQSKPVGSSEKQISKGGFSHRHHSAYRKLVAPAFAKDCVAMLD